MSYHKFMHLFANKDLLEAFLGMHRPHIVLLQETWLNETHESVTIFEYDIVSRRDRKATENRGGLLTPQRSDFNCLVHIKNCADEERSYHYLRLGFETILLAN